MLDFAGVKTLMILEGKVKKITRKSDGVVLWEMITSDYTNLADPTSAEWKTNKRINSSGKEVDVALSGMTMVMTNLIDITGATNDTKYHIKGLDLLEVNATSGLNRVYFYDENKTYKTYWIPTGNYVSQYLQVSDYDENVQILTKIQQLMRNIPELSGVAVKYIVFGAIITGTAEDVVVTKNEEIVTSYINLADTSSPDWAYNSRLNSSGDIDDKATGRNVTNYIPYTDGDVLKLKNLTLYTVDRFAVYDGDKNRIYLGTGSSLSTCIVKEENGVIYFDTAKIKEISSTASGGEYIRFPVQLIEGATPIITTGDLNA